MAHTKAGGTTRNVRDSQPKYLGIKLSDGGKGKTGQIIIRQRGNKFVAGKNVGQGKDHTLFALKDGIVKFQTKRKTGFDGKIKRISVINLIPIN